MKKVLLFNLLITLFGFGFSQDSPKLDSTDNPTSQLVITMPFELIAQNFSKDMLGEIPVTLKLVSGKGSSFIPKSDTMQTEMAQTEMTKTEKSQTGDVQSEISKTEEASTEMVKAKMPKTEDAEAEEELKGTFAVNILHNSFAGIHPAIFGSIPTRKGPTFTFYGVFWSNPFFGNPASGNDFWFEHGFGVAIPALKGKLLVNPSIGFAHGKLLSGHNSTVIGDGIIPSLFTHYGGERLTVDFYFAYYKSLRQGPNASADFIFNWVNPLIKVNKFLSVGAYYEQFVNTRTSEKAPVTSINQWLGGSIKLSTGKGPAFMVALGKNFSGVGGKEFHKISASFPIN